MADSERSRLGGDEAGLPERQEELDQLLERIAAHIAQVDKSAGVKAEPPSDGHAGTDGEAHLSPGEGGESGPVDEQVPPAEPDGLRDARAGEEKGDSEAHAWSPLSVEPPALRSALKSTPARTTLRTGMCGSGDEAHQEPSGASSEGEAYEGARSDRSKPTGEVQECLSLDAPEAGAEPWDSDSAEALTRAYEAEDTVPPLRSMLNLMAQPGSPAGRSASGGAARSASVLRGGISNADIDAAQTRLFEAAQRVEAMLDRLAPKDAVEALGERFQSLEGEVRRSGDQLARLDGIEHRLGELGQKLTDEQVLNLFGSIVPTAEELTQFAEDAAGRAAERVLENYARNNPSPPEAHQPSNAQPPPATSAQLTSLGELLAAFMDERRRSDASTLEALETLQLAMQHVLDRIERVDGGAEPAKASMAQIGGESRHDARAEKARREIAQSHEDHDAHDPSAAAADSGFDDLADTVINLTANQGAPDLTAESYRMPEPLAHDFDAPPGRQSQTEMPTAPYLPAAAPIQGRKQDDGLYEPPHAPEFGGEPSPARAHTETGEIHPMNDRQILIAKARKAAERAKADAGSTGKIKTDKARALKSGMDKALAAGASAGIIRPGVLLIAIAAILFAGYWFLFGQKHGLLRPSASSAVEQTLAGEVTPSANRAPAVDEPARAGLSETASEAPMSAPLSADRQQASADPAAGEAAGPGMTVAFESSPASFDTVMKARERARIANLSQRTAYSAVRSHGVVEMPARAGAAAEPQSHSQSRQASSIETSSVAPHAGSAPQIASAPPGQDTRQLVLPAAKTGPLSLRLAAARGDSAAQLEIATRLAEGKGVRQNFAEAARWYERAAEQGQPIAQYRLATLYERGMGVKADRKKAQALYAEAAQRGNLKAMHNLAVISASPTSGTPDYAAAARLFARAAEHGLNDSQYNLGVLYESGLGVPKDHAAAYKWYSLAARGGDTVAARRRDMLISRLPPETLQAMDKQIAAWQVRPADEAANNARLAGSAWMQGQGQANRN